MITHRDGAARVFTVEQDDAFQRPFGEVKESSVEGGDDRERTVVHHCFRHVLEAALRRGSSADVANDYLIGAVEEDKEEVMCFV